MDTPEKATVDVLTPAVKAFAKALPVSDAQAAADNLRNLKTNNLSDVPDKAKALSNLGGISTTAVASAIGDPETDLVAAYNSAKKVS